MVVAMPKFKLMQKLVDGVNLVSRKFLPDFPLSVHSEGKKEEERFDEANKN